MKIYVASSWRNQYQQGIVALLSKLGHNVYDFKNPAPGNHGFHWSQIDPAWQSWTPRAFRKALTHKVAVDGFNSDMNALRACDLCVLVLPSGRSAHLEAGWVAGAGRPVIVFIPEDVEPELMYGMTSGICTTEEELVSAIAAHGIGQSATAMPSFTELLESIGEAVVATVLEKNAAYGSSFAKAGEFLKLLYPTGLSPEQYGDALLLVRIFDKQMRVANRKDAFSESPYRDMTGYGLLGAAKDEAK